MEYTKRQLRLYQLKDMLIDIRCAYRDGMDDYAMSIERDVLTISRNNATMNQYGYFQATCRSNNP